MDPTQKRRNPFDLIIEEKVSESVVSEQPKPRQEPVYSQPQSTRTTRQPVYQQPVRGRRVEELQGREKYTSTMERSLRRQIKIACVNKGILFAQYIEEACREKLAREGMM